MAYAPLSAQLEDMIGPETYLVLCSCDPLPTLAPPIDAGADTPPGTGAADAAAPKALQPGEGESEHVMPRLPNGRYHRGGQTSNSVPSLRATPKRNEADSLKDHLSLPPSHPQRERKKSSPFDPQEGAASRWQSDMSKRKELNRRSRKKPIVLVTRSKRKGSNKQTVSRTDTNATRDEPTSCETLLALREALTEAYSSPMSVSKFCNVNSLPQTTLYSHMHRSRLIEMKQPFDDEVAKKIDDYIRTLETKRRGAKLSNKWTRPKRPNSVLASKVSGREELQGPPPKKAKTQQTIRGRQVRRPAVQHYEVGSRHFYRLKDGVEYPVIVQVQPGGPGCKLKANERRIVFEDYPITTRRANTTQLLLVTPAREKELQAAKCRTSGRMREEREQKWLKGEEERRKKRQAKQEATKRAQRRCRDQDQAKRLEKQEKKKFGDRTTYWGPFPEGEKAGALIAQDTRRVYVAKNDETPSIIAKRFGVPVGKVVYDNRPNYPSLRENTRLKPLTLIVLPLEERVKHHEDANLVPDEVVSSCHSEPTEFDDSIKSQREAALVRNAGDASLGHGEKLKCNESVSSYQCELTEFGDSIENQQDAVMPVSNDGYASLECDERPICDNDFSSFLSDTEFDYSIENQKDVVTEDRIKEDHLLAQPSSRVATKEFAPGTTASSLPQKGFSYLVPRQ